MSDFEKNKSLMNGKGEDDVQWITVKGNHIPIKDGENPQEAIKNHFANKNKANDTNNEKISQMQRLVDVLNKIKKIKIKEMHTFIKSLQPINLQINGDEIFAEFDEFTADKNIYKPGNSDVDGFSYKLEHYKEFPEFIKNSNYIKSKSETGKSTKQHKGVDSWHYFRKDISTDKGVFNITINIRNKKNRHFIYEVSLKKKKT